MAATITNGHIATSEGLSINDAATTDDIRATLHELGQREASVTTRLDYLLASQKDLSRQLSRLDLARAQLGTQVVSTRAISHGMLVNAAATAHRISAAVRTLDQEQAAVKATLEVVEQVAELKACVLGVHGSMGAPQDWETAASYLHRAAQIPDAVTDGAFAGEIVPTAEVPDSPRQTLDAAAESLCGLFLREFEKAAKDGDGTRVTRFFKLFPLVGRREVGLEAYGRYVCSGIAARARNTMSAGGRQRDGIFYANAVTKLFEHIAQIVEGHEPLVERHYGPGSMTKVIERIQIEADAQGGLILDTWAEERRISRRLTDVKSYPFNFLVQSFLPAQRSALPISRTGTPVAGGAGNVGNADDGIDMKDVDALLNESAIMLGRWSLYTRFLANKVAASHKDEQTDDRLHLPAFIIHSTLQKKVSDLLVDPFNILATFFFRRSVEKSFQLDEPPSDLSLDVTKALGSNPPFITSAVDDVMYIVNQLLQRTLATSQRAVVASVVPSIGRVLGGDFFSMIQRKMRDESYPKAAIQGAMPPQHLIISFIVLMNNLDVATDYVKRIINTSLDQPRAPNSTPSQQLTESFAFGHEAVFVDKQLRTMETGFESKTAELLTEAIEVLLKQVMRPRLRPVLADAFRDVDYSLNTNDPAVNDHDDIDPAADDEDAVTHRFERGWTAFTQPVRRLLTPANYDRTLAGTLLSLARTLEKRLWACYGRVSDLGAVRMERDVAGIVAAATRNAGGKSYELRELFARCVQITVIVGMEEDEWEEIKGLDGVALERATGVVWKLDGEERKKARMIIKDRV